ncbi:MAG TPA: BamA/TamA family outer membrane protein [Gammaproteobacteria bacterium]|nr:BamA/TamA family outer membrane protein [Gammaproteobacteria bacterium]
MPARRHATTGREPGDPLARNRRARADGAPVTRGRRAPYRRVSPLTAERPHSARSGRLAGVPESLCILLMLGGGFAGPARAGVNASTENAISQIMIQSAYTRSTEAAEKSGRPVHRGSQSAILPQVAENPSEGILVGFEYANRDFTPAHLAGSAGLVYTTEGQRAFDGSMLVPELFTLANRPVLDLMQVRYFMDPTQEYFGLGNNSAGPNPLSTHSIRRETVLETLGWRLTPRVTLALTAGLNHVSIGKGVRGDASTPYTTSLFPHLVGIHGGMTNPVSLSVIYDDRKNLTEPSRGWNAYAKIQHVGPELGSDYHYTRYAFSASYLFPIVNADHVMGVRLRGQYLNGSVHELPFYELASLGGDQNMEGYHKDRFLGQSDILFTTEYRQKLSRFNFRDLWNVRLDGVLFGDAGRVFVNAKSRQQQFRVNSDLIPRVIHNFRYDYGAGLRIALGQVLVARLDLGFSQEYKGLTYLSFSKVF